MQTNMGEKKRTTIGSAPASCSGTRYPDSFETSSPSPLISNLHHTFESETMTFEKSSLEATEQNWKLKVVVWMVVVSLRLLPTDDYSRTRDYFLHQHGVDWWES
jgi:hypothetical protein